VSSNVVQFEIWLDGAAAYSTTVSYWVASSLPVLGGSSTSGSAVGGASGEIFIAAGNPAGTVTITATAPGMPAKVITVNVSATNQYGYTSGGS
jgi:hypothetical protein